MAPQGGRETRVEQPGADRAAWADVRRFGDASALAAALRGAGIDDVTLRHGPYESSQVLLGLGPLVLQRVEDGAHVTRGVVQQGAAALLFSLHHETPSEIRGHVAGPDDMLLLNPGAELHGLSRARVEWGSIVMPEARVAALRDAAGLESAPMLLLPRAAAAPIRRAFTAATDLALTATGPGFSPPAAAALAGGFWDLLAGAFAGAEAPQQVPRATRVSLRILDAAEDYLRAHLARPVYTDELCGVLGVSPRTLHKAFVATCAMSPQAYLKRRRLMQVHVALGAPGADAPLVKAVALAHGFWHLGHFAQAYRAMFGCTPSETAGRGRSRASEGSMR